MIRTLWIDRDRVTFHVGGGIVADSVPESEWHETQHKAAAMLAALRAGADGTARFDDARSIRRRRDHHVVGDWGTIP